ncbi:MAG: glycosyltransferase family 4 protein [Bacteroidales bacterium]|nr:glycosyltransferase family 4 protein [Bacteroidales bacterium]
MINKKIHICFFSPASYPFFYSDSQAIHGGAEFQMYLLATELAKNKNFSISFILGNYGQKNRYCYKKNIQLIKGFKLTTHENLWSKFIKALRLFFLYYKIKPDVIITTNAGSVVGLTAFYTKLSGKKYIYRSSSSIDVDGSWINSHKLMGKIYSWGLKNTSLVLSQNAEHCHLLIKNHSIKTNILKNGFVIETTHAQNKKYILWVSRYVEMKNPHLFLQLAKQIPNEKFVMICPYNPSDYKKWKELKNEADKILNLTFIEKVDFRKIQTYFNQAKIFVNTSDYEGFPNTFLQAAQGLTPIVSLNVNPDNFINEYQCGIFCNNGFSKLIEETKKILQDSDKIKQMGKNAYRYLKENHDINIIGKQMEEIIYNLVKS